MRKLFYTNSFALLSAFLLLNICCSCNKKDDNIIIAVKKYEQMPLPELLDKGDSFSNDGIKDSAAICYAMIYNRTIAERDTLSQQIVCKALNRTSNIFFDHYDYTRALELLLRALEICENIDYKDYIGRIYNNIGNVNYQLKDYKSARRYYQQGYDNSEDRHLVAVVINNLGLLAQVEKKPDSALSFFKQSYRIIKYELRDTIDNEVLNNNIGNAYTLLKHYDSAFFYLRASLKDARKVKNEEYESMALSNIGQVYFKLNDYDSAIYYFTPANLIAERLLLFDVLSHNYLSISKILENRGKINEAFDYYKKYSIAKDSLSDASEYVVTTELQFRYDMAKIDRHIKELNIEQEIKDRTIAIQYRLQAVLILVLLVVIAFLILFYLKNKTLNRAYNDLVVKNMEIVNCDKLNEELRREYEEKLCEKERIIEQLKIGRKTSIIEPYYQSMAANSTSTKYKDSSLKNDYRDELVAAILKIMEHKEVYCDVEFSVEKLSKMIGSNSTYISQIMTDIFRKNFRSFINDYRIKEARRILSDPDCKKYTIESIGTMVGFKSRRTFDITFKELTGISPSFYTKSRK